MADLRDRFDPIPSWARPPEVLVAVSGGAPGAGGHGLLGVPLPAEGDVPPELGLGREQLAAAGLTGEAGTAGLLARPGDGPPLVVFGTGTPGALDAAALRDAGAAFAGAAALEGRLALLVPAGSGVAPAAAAQALVEGVLLARYRFEVLKRSPQAVPVAALTLLVAGPDVAEAERGARRGLLFARATMLARDLANSPPSLLTAAVLAEVASGLAADTGLTAEVFDQAQLVAMGCGGLLGVNAGSADPARMIKLRYTPAGAAAAGPAGEGAARVTLVGKGVMYDSGGISLKPADAVHATMKNDMSGAGAILAAMSVLRELDCRTAVTGYLMCTDNMPSGTATKLGDVLSIRGGTTVEVINTDAEGRLIMADALVLATEEPTDAIVDIATLTGAAMRALGAEIAGVFGNRRPLVEQVLAAARATDEPAWQLPLARRYRAELDSDVADVKNMGGPNGGAIHAALFLEDFVAGAPWAHLDIAGPAQNDRATAWRPKGCTGFGARLLTEFLLGFTPPGRPRPGSGEGGEVARDER
ncbi:M17 family peptidase N-terminal domain-containing protein [Streptomyces sp. CB03911]|uniref:leucyl aminopeptidase family protein n=1 Tax=Streptomycetaceae TaxID=2062 RepID=UPI0009396678|nr:M17 family peptidase N-terminal domain-containing protein [Streptomyces sp. CB03911]OKI28832.1 leucyl aminopeptidase [Streptomyces sp. CB03911]